MRTALCQGGGSLSVSKPKLSAGLTTIEKSPGRRLVDRDWWLTGLTAAEAALP